MSYALTAAAANALSNVLLSTHTVEDGHPSMPDPADNETTSVIDPASLTPPPVPLQYLGLSQYVSSANASALDSRPIQPRNSGQSQFVSPGATQALNPQPLPPGGGVERTSLDDDWCGTPPHPGFPPHPPGPWAELAASALAFR
jgi:hypothetical protein